MRRCPNYWMKVRRSNVRWYEWVLVGTGRLRPYRCQYCSHRYWAAPGRRSGGPSEQTTTDEYSADVSSPEDREATR
jgi:hypothetical protein